MLYDEIQKVNYTLASQNDIDYDDDIVNRLQKINNELSSIYISIMNYIKSAFFFPLFLFVIFSEYDV